MTEATLTWSIWQALLYAFACSFTRRGFRRFAEWITAMALNVEEHTITQSVLALEQPAAWKALEILRRVRRLARGPRHLRPDPPDRRPPRVGSGTAIRSRPSMTPRSIAPARTSGGPAPSTSTPPAAPTAPAPSAPTTGWSSAPCSTSPRSPAGSCRSPAGSTSASRSCRPGPAGTAGVPDQVRAGRRAAPRAGADRPRPQAPGRLRRRLRAAERGPAAGPPRGRLAPDRLPHPVAARRPALRPAARRSAPRGVGGPSRSGAGGWPRPAGAAGGSGEWRTGSAFVYGRQRKVRWKEVVCLWRVLGREVPVKAIVAEVEGYKKRFTLVTSAMELTGLQMVELFAARFRQEDGFRDLKQRLGWEECRAWTSQPDRADQPGAMGDDEPAAAVAVPAGGVRGGGLVVPAAVAQGQGSSQRAGRGAADAAACGGDSATSVGVAGR